MDNQNKTLNAQCKKLEREGVAAQDNFAQAVQQTEAEFDDNTERMKVELEHVKDDSRNTVEELSAQIHLCTRFGCCDRFYCCSLYNRLSSLGHYCDGWCSAGTT